MKVLKERNRALRTALPALVAYEQFALALPVHFSKRKLMAASAAGAFPAFVRGVDKYSAPVWNTQKIRLWIEANYAGVLTADELQKSLDSFDSHVAAQSEAAMT